MTQQGTRQRTRRPVATTGIVLLALLLLMPLWFVAGMLRDRAARQAVVAERPAPFDAARAAFTWSLDERRRELLWRGELPGRRRGDEVEWRARAWWGVPGQPHARLLADSGQQLSSFFPNHTLDLGRFPAPEEPGMVTLEIDYLLNGVRGEERRRVPFVPPITPEQAAERLDTAIAALREELGVASKYGVVWPEAEALAAALEQSGPEETDVVWALSAAGWARAGLVERRHRPDLWRRTPGRSLTDVRWEDGRAWRHYWVPGGARREPVLPALSPGEPDLYGTTALWTKDPEQAAHARRRNLAVVTHPRGAWPAGLWAPFSGKEKTARGRWHRSVQMLAVRQWENELGPLDWDERVYTAQGVWKITPSGWIAAPGEIPPLALEALGAGGLAVEVNAWYRFGRPGGQPGLGMAFLLPAVEETRGDAVNLRDDAGGGKLFATGPIQYLTVTAERGGERLETLLEGPLDIPGSVLFHVP